MGTVPTQGTCRDKANGLTRKRKYGNVFSGKLFAAFFTQAFLKNLYAIYLIAKEIYLS